jgi:hypothetical protein
MSSSADSWVCWSCRWGGAGEEPLECPRCEALLREADPLREAHRAVVEGIARGLDRQIMARGAAGADLEC